MSDIFREVDEALQQEKLANIWKEYRTTIIAAIVVMLVSTGLGKTYFAWDAARNADETTRIMAAFDSDKPQDAINALVDNTRAGHKTIALLNQASLYLSDDKKQDAAAIYKQLADSRKTPRSLRNLARILYVQNTDTPEKDVLTPLLHDERSPWIWHARIEAAVLSAHQDQDYKTALAHLSAFDTVTTIPLSLKQRGQALQHVYKIKQSEIKTEG